MRFLIYMFVLTPIVGNIATKLSHKIFGKPTKTAEEEKKVEQEKLVQQNPEPVFESNSSPPPLVDQFHGRPAG